MHNLQVPAWTAHIVEGILKKLAGLQKPMKYVCHVSLTQRAGAGLHAASCSRWNPKTDGAQGEKPGCMPAGLPGRLLLPAGWPGQHCLNMRTTG